MTANVSLRLLYQIFDRLLHWLTLLGCASASKDAEELSSCRHRPALALAVPGRRLHPACRVGPRGLRPDMPGSWLPTRQTPSSRSGALRAGGYSPKQIARALHLRPAVVAPLVRKLAAEEAAAAPEPALFGCWVSPGWSRNLTTDTHRDWPDLPVPEDGPGGIAARVAVARRHRPHRVSVCGYLVDTYCLGVKNALGPKVMNERDLPGFLRDYFTPFAEVGGSLAVPLDLARHLVWGAADHARSLGFEPTPHFTAAAGHLGSWAETSALTFGRDERPET